MRTKILFLFAAALIVSSSVFCEMNVQEVVEKANLVAYYQGDDGKAKVNMTITDSLGRQRNREFTILRRDVKDGEGQKFFVYFHKPSDVQDMVYMVWKHLGRDDDRWLYLPALDLVRRIASSDKRSSFVGSDFVYEDISGRSLKEDAHELIEITEDYYLVKNTPKKPNEVEFKYFTVKIDKDTFMPILAEYYDAGGKLYRKVEALEVKDIQGFPTVVKSKASDLESGSSTITTFSQIKYDIGLDDDVFSERYLRRPPRKWLE